MIVILVLPSICFSQGGIGINTTSKAADNSAILDVSATGKGLLIPRMTTAKRPANPVESLIIYNTDTRCFEAYNAATSQWVNIACLSNSTCGGNVTDVDGNVYNTVKIGEQCWMKENLETTKYNDGTAIPLVTDNAAWTNLTTPGYCWYNNDAATYKSTYGALYNWYAVNTAKLCPAGWYVPSDVEWTTLTDYLGGESIAGGKMKEAGYSHWFSPNTGADNSSGFSVLPSGYRYLSGGSFDDLGYDADIWSSSEVNGSYAWYRFLDYRYADVGRNGFSKTGGFSARCLKD